MMTNLLAMPLVTLSIETGNNEDWIDAIKFLMDNGEPELPQLDIRDIIFEMEVRSTSVSHEVILAASTEVNDTLQVGWPPDYGFLIIAIPVSTMKTIRPGDYVADIIGRDMINSRVIAKMALTITDGVTIQPVVAK